MSAASEHPAGNVQRRFTRGRVGRIYIDALETAELQRRMALAVKPRGRVQELGVLSKRH